MMKHKALVLAGVMVGAMVGHPVTSNAAPVTYLVPVETAASSVQVMNVSSIFKNNRNNSRSEAISKHNPNASILGQMLGGARSIDIAGQGAAGYNSRHVAFCVRTYGSYNLRDNSFLAFSGERKQCRSPYMNLGN